jgi:cyclase
MRPRIIPILLLDNGSLYKTQKFAHPTYVGDPVNAVKIFNDKEVDELCLLDIKVTKNGSDPDFGTIKDIAGECFMPLSYGGGIKSTEIVRELLGIGIEKVIINSAAYTVPNLINDVSERFGVSTVVGSIDVKKTLTGKQKVMIHGGSEPIPYSPVDWAIELVRRGVGEIIVNSIDRDGAMQGYDVELIKRVSSAVSVPVVAAGGAGSLDHLLSAIKYGGASAVAAGSMFVFQGKHRAVLITYPNEAEVSSIWDK